MRTKLLIAFAAWLAGSRPELADSQLDMRSEGRRVWKSTGPRKSSHTRPESVEPEMSGDFAKLMGWADAVHLGRGDEGFQRALEAGLRVGRSAWDSSDSISAVSTTVA